MVRGIPPISARPSIHLHFPPFWRPEKAYRMIALSFPRDYDQEESWPAIPKMGRLFVNFSMVIISTLLGLLILEAILRIAGHEPLYFNPERLIYWTHDPILGWSHRPGQEGRFETPRFNTSIRINRRRLFAAEYHYGY